MLHSQRMLGSLGLILRTPKARRDVPTCLDGGSADREKLTSRITLADKVPAERPEPTLDQVIQAAVRLVNDHGRLRAHRGPVLALAPDE
jgi:hypothetical protein